MLESGDILTCCTLCPRQCKADRTKSKGFCGEGKNIRIAAYKLHMWEEPVISGQNGSGAVFFSGCVLRCVFCQNHEISTEKKGYVITVQRLSEIFLELQSKGAHNINLVNPTHFVPQIISALDLVKDKLEIPIVYNSGGYERVETLERLKNYVDIFLPDIKYFDSALAVKYSNAPDYFNYAMSAVKKMAEITGKPVIENGVLKKGTVIRHLVLPNCRHDSIEIVRRIGKAFKSDDILLSLMSQYMPVYKAKSIKELNRRISTFEYESVVQEASMYGFDGFIQERSSAVEEYVPKFYDSPKE